MHNPEFILENVTLQVPRDFEIQTEILSDSYQKSDSLQKKKKKKKKEKETAE